ncbi:hypothetical protein [Helicobacter sp. T3_23-1056]
MWVSLDSTAIMGKDSTSVIADNDSASVIANKYNFVKSCKFVAIYYFFITLWIATRCVATLAMTL